MGEAARELSQGYWGMQPRFKTPQAPQTPSSLRIPRIMMSFIPGEVRYSGGLESFGRKRLDCFEHESSSQDAPLLQTSSRIIVDKS